jgi:hypothetical protein
MAPVAQISKKPPRPADETDWLSLFPVEAVPPQGELERPSVEDPFEWFPAERHLIDRPSVVLPIRQVPPAPRPALTMAGRPAVVISWRPQRTELTPRGWAAIAAVVAAPFFLMGGLTRVPPLPDVASALAFEAHTSIDLPAFALAAPRTRPAAAPTAVSSPPLAAAEVQVPPATVPKPSAAKVEVAAPLEPPPASLASLMPSVSPPPVSPQPEPIRVTEAPAVVTPPPPLLLPDTLVPVASTASEARPVDTTAIEEVLGRYRGAYGALDPGAVQKAFPRVDRKALERNFAELDEQTLQFDDCQIDITGRDARVACRGSSHSVSKGATRPRLESRRWDFTLSKIGSSWLILSAQSKR